VPSRRKTSRSTNSRKRSRTPAKRASAASSPVRQTEPTRISQADRAAGEWFARLVALQERLRGPAGCPWDAAQTHESLRKFLVEETYETLDAMDSGDAKKFASELGDLLLQIVFHSVLARESGRFTISDVIESIHSKMVRRHPHVFGSVKARTSSEVLKNWEQLKALERADEKSKSAGDAKQDSQDDSILGGVPRSLPAVLEAAQLTGRAANIGFDWENLAGILDKLEEEKRELQSVLGASSISAQLVSGSQHGVDTNVASSKQKLPPRDAKRIEEEVGDLLFVVVNIARFLGVDPEASLKKSIAKFKRRFQWMESAAERDGKRLAEVPRDKMEALWNESKKHAPPAEAN